MRTTDGRAAQLSSSVCWVLTACCDQHIISTVVNDVQHWGAVHGTSACECPWRRVSLSRRTLGRAGLKPLHSSTIFAF